MVSHSLQGKNVINAQKRCENLEVLLLLVTCATIGKSRGGLLLREASGFPRLNPGVTMGSAMCRHYVMF